ncbi:MAG: FeoB-associated Cys-rich membrane protein [Lautropia sp.]|nr:FeoB-associated Cys-rich membrane protein [Lautropia sp.]
MLENIIVGAIVVAAALYVLRKFFFKKKGGKDPACGSCDACNKGGGCH